MPTFSFLDPHLGFEHIRFSFEFPLDQQLPVFECHYKTHIWSELDKDPADNDALPSFSWLPPPTITFFLQPPHNHLSFTSTPRLVNLCFTSWTLFNIVQCCCRIFFCDDSKDDVVQNEGVDNFCILSTINNLIGKAHKENRNKAFLVPHHHQKIPSKQSGKEIITDNPFLHTQKLVLVSSNFAPIKSSLAVVFFALNQLCTQLLILWFWAKHTHKIVQI